MKKIALFVEGQTEAIFVKQLLIEVAARDRIKFRDISYNAGKLKVIRIESGQGAEKYQASIYDCGRDEHVKSLMLDNAESLKREGFDLVVGLRDLRGFKRTDLIRTRRLQNKGLNRYGIRMEIVFAVMEIEAWFVEEWKHFQGIHYRLTPERIGNRLAFNPRLQRASTLDRPAEFLNSAYHIFNKAYRKTKAHVTRTVNAMNFEHFYEGVRHKVTEADRLLTLIDDFL